MKLTLYDSISETNTRWPLRNGYISMTGATRKSAFLLLSFLILLFFSNAQSISPSTINISGQSATFGNYQIEWSVGESASTITMTNSNVVITSGVLQAFAAYQPVLNSITFFLPDEIKIYPYPTRAVIEINTLHKIVGKNKLELFDRQGRKVMEKEFEYYGTPSVEKWDLSQLSDGQYFLHIQLLNFVTGKTIKKGAFKILKIQ